MSTKNQPENTLLISIRIKPNSRTIKIEKNEDILVFVKSAPVKGKANKELVNILSEEWNISKNQISIIAGHKSRKKMIKIVDLSANQKNRILDYNTQ